VRQGYHRSDVLLHFVDWSDFDDVVGAPIERRYCCTRPPPPFFLSSNLWLRYVAAPESSYYSTPKESAIVIQSGHSEVPFLMLISFTCSSYVKSMSIFIEEEEGEEGGLYYLIIHSLAFLLRPCCSRQTVNSAIPFDQKSKKGLDWISSIS
jgi:hypothetical protein